MGYKIGDEIRVVRLLSGDKDYYEIGDTFIVDDISDEHEGNMSVLWTNEYARGLYASQVELVEKEVKEVKMGKSYNRMEMFVELKKDNSKVFRNNSGTEFYVNSEGELKGRTSEGRIYSPDLVFTTNAIYMEVPKPYAERIKRGDTYYFLRIDLTHINSMIRDLEYNGNWEDKKMIDRGNFFETKEEAQEKLNKILEILKGE